MEQHFRFSSFREKLIEHLFVGELLKTSWLRGECSLEVARPEVDNRGYDIIVERDGVVRHIQLKASHRDARASSQKIHVGLGQKPSGCVIWVVFDQETLALGPFLFLGGDAGQPLPSIADFRIAKHVKANMGGIKAERPDLRVVPKSRFRVLRTFDDVYEQLFTRPAAAPVARPSNIDAIEANLHQIIRARAAEFGLDEPASLPSLDASLPDQERPAWYVMNGMYGGFSYWFTDPAAPVELICESWSRVLEGSGQRHRVDAESVVLDEEGFV